MIRRRIVALAAILSITLSGCAGLESQSTIKPLESEQVTADIGISEEAEGGESSISLSQDEIIPSEEVVSTKESENAEDVVANNEVATVATVETVLEEIVTGITEEFSKPETFTPSENTSTFEHDAANDMYVINGTPYEIEPDGVDYHAGYMFWGIGNTEMELITYYINGKYQEKYWREDCVPELLEKAENSTLLESFMNGGGRIENYYALTSPEFYYTYYEADVPFVVEYSYGEETYHTILIMRLNYEEITEDYRIVDMIQMENLDNYEEQVAKGGETPALETFTPPENTSTFEHDAANDRYIINGTSYDIASDEFDFHGGYMFYCMGKGVIEEIACYINGECQEKYWRDGYTPELLEEAENSTLLESFINSGARIENYYILTHPNFYVAEMTVVVEYSLGGEIYHTILGIGMDVEAKEEEVIYRVTDVFQLENLDEWEKWFEELNLLGQ